MVQHSGALGVARQVVWVMDFRKNQGKQPQQNKRLRNIYTYIYVYINIYIMYIYRYIYIYILSKLLKSFRDMWYKLAELLYIQSSTRI